MSKFFNEIQKADELALKQLEAQKLDFEQVLQTVETGPVASPNVAGVEPDSQRKRENPNNGNGMPPVLRRDSSAQAAFEGYQRLRTRLMRIQAKTGVRVIAISSSQVGEGKTLTTMNLGLCFAQLSDSRVLMIDTDLRSRGLTRLLGLSDGPGLAGVLTGEVSQEEAILATDHENLFVMPAGSALTPPPELFTGPRWEEILGLSRKSFKIVMVDTPPILPLADFELISSACDGVLMVVRARRTSRELLQKTVGAIDAKKLLGTVFNATEVSSKNYYGYANHSR